MPPFSRDRDYGNSGNSGNFPQRRPKPRPSGYAPQRFDPMRARERPAPRPPKPRRPSGPARIAPRQPVSGKQRRAMLKAASWRLAKIIHVRPAEVMKVLATQPRLEVAFPNISIPDRWGEAARLAVKIWRLNKPLLPPVKPQAAPVK